MTNTPAMPELPDVPLIRISTGHGVEWAKMYTSDQMRAYAIATLQAQPAELSDAEIDEVWRQHNVTNEAFGEVMDAQAFEHAARAILALRPQAVPMTDMQVLQSYRSSPISHNADPLTWFEAGVRSVEARHGITAPAGGE